MDPIFFNNWQGIYRTLLVGVLAYIALVAILRTSGKRTLTKLNAFDFVVTIAIGSTLATIMLNKDVPLAEGVLVFALLCMLQYAVTWSSVRSAWVRGIVKSEPQLLLLRGEPLAGPMKRERVTLDEIRAAARAEKICDLKQVDAVILETDGTLSILPSLGERNAKELSGVRSS